MQYEFEMPSVEVIPTVNAKYQKLTPQPKDTVPVWNLGFFHAPADLVGKHVTRIIVETTE